jgi:hypothetical protein
MQDQAPTGTGAANDNVSPQPLRAVAGDSTKPPPTDGGEPQVTTPKRTAPGRNQSRQQDAPTSQEATPNEQSGAQADANAAEEPVISIHSKSGNAWVTTEGEIKPKGTFTKVRSRYEQRKVSAGTGDDAGHRAAASQAGSAGRENLARQNRIMNRAGGSWRKLEVEFDKATANGFKVRRKISDVYRPQDHGRTSWDANFAKDLEANPRAYRPYRRHVEWTITDAEGNVESGEHDFVNTKTPGVRENEMGDESPTE